MHLSRFPRRGYVNIPTPIEFASNLTELLGGPQIYIKRDDLLPGAGGGNKTRKLDFCIADALQQGADTLITCGAVQSNHCRLTLGWAAKEGLRCRLVLEERVPGSYKPEASGNNFLFHLMGVDKVTVVPGGSNMGEAMEEAAENARKQGLKPYIIPGGASNPLGALGYVSCAMEMLGQLFEMKLDLDHVVVPSGSAGTHAGMLTGLWGANTGLPVSGVNVSRTKAEQEALVHGLTEKLADTLGLRSATPAEEVVCYDQYVGPGYSLPTDSMVEAVSILAKTEAILLDPVYSGKAMAGMIDLIRKGVFSKGQKILFLHTGGSPALYAYLDTFRHQGPAKA
ncbi:D-cysteine desulfhydrase [Desulfonatronovibrio magnus]|uniref:D-cysteine desulfhydrase n=1 Tax=Desulfonatronovibrio magnus TaxID=698827 RepID=UPI0005EB6ABD|nr:D-cysteine desulfhydrase [Desulfonatronovibrio magnus]